MLQCGPDHMHHYCICQPVLLYDWRWVRRGGEIFLFVVGNSQQSAQHRRRLPTWVWPTGKDLIRTNEKASLEVKRKKICKRLSFSFSHSLSLSLSLSLWHSAEIWRLGCFYWSSRTKRRARKSKHSLNDLRDNAATRISLSSIITSSTRARSIRTSACPPIRTFSLFRVFHKQDNPFLSDRWSSNLLPSSYAKATYLWEISSGSKQEIGGSKLNKGRIRREIVEGCFCPLALTPTSLWVIALSRTNWTVWSIVA